MAYFKPNKCDRPKTKVYCKDCLFFHSKWEQRYMPADDLCLTQPESESIAVKDSYREAEHVYEEKSLALCKKRNAKNNCAYYIKKTFWNKFKHDDKIEEPSKYITQCC